MKVKAIALYVVALALIGQAYGQSVKRHPGDVLHYQVARSRRRRCFQTYSSRRYISKRVISPQPINNCSTVNLAEIVVRRWLPGLLNAVSRFPRTSPMERTNCFRLILARLWPARYITKTLACRRSQSKTPTTSQSLLKSQ